MKVGFLLAMLVAITAKTACAGTAGERAFAPKGCDYALTFPITPEVQAPSEVAPGLISTTAQTPPGSEPWLFATCTQMPSDSDPLESATLESQDKAALERRHARNITSFSTKDARGQVTTTVGELTLAGDAMVMTKVTIVGPHSILYLAALESTKDDRSITKDFFAHIVRVAR